MHEWANDTPKNRPSGPWDRLPPGAKIWIPTLGQMLLMPVSELFRLDLGLRNLLCAADLPDTQGLDLNACLAKLHDWVQHVKAETDRNMHRFLKAPGDYYQSEAYFRVLMMITILQQDLGVRYDPDSIKTQSFHKSSEGLIHGLLQGEGGTCANMPYLYAAVGRRLRYPIYICAAKGHLFCRWLSKNCRERFNIEASGVGLNVYPDEYYMSWPRKIPPDQIPLGFYLRNLNPAEEVAHCMAIRGHYLHDTGHRFDAIVAYSNAHRLAPCEPQHFASLMGVLNDELKAHYERRLPNSYREWDDFNKIACPRLYRDVLKDDFPRVSKSRPPFVPKDPIVPKQEENCLGSQFKWNFLTRFCVRLSSDCFYLNSAILEPL